MLSEPIVSSCMPIESSFLAGTAIYSTCKYTFLCILNGSMVFYSSPHTFHVTVGATHSKSSASQSQARNLQLLSNASVNTYPWRWNSWIYNLLLGKTYINTCFPSGPTQSYIKGRYSKKDTRPDQTRSDHWDLRKTAAEIVHLYTSCITYNKDLYEEVNHGYLFTLWYNLRRWKQTMPT
jgi:hypothetical protein